MGIGLKRLICLLIWMRPMEQLDLMSFSLRLNGFAGLKGHRSDGIWHRLFQLVVD